MKILLTGITGFIGSSLAKRLYATDHEVIALVRNKLDVPEEIKSKFNLIRADLDKDIPFIECDLVIHCASIVSEKILSHFLNKTNVEGTRKLLNSVPDTAKIIHLSSASVYNISSKSHAESDKIDQTLLTPYGRSKLLAERLYQEEFNDRHVCILRPRAVYGKGDRVFLPRLLKLYKNGKIRVPGDLRQNASMTHIDLLLDIIMELIHTQWEGQETYNVCDKSVYELRMFFTSLLEGIFDREIKVVELNEMLVRIFAGIRTVLVPGNQFTQTSIDYITRDHILDRSKLEQRFPHLKDYKMPEYLPEYIRWVKDVGVKNILMGDKRISWK